MSTMYDPNFIAVSADEALQARGGRSLMSLALERCASAPPAALSDEFKSAAVQERARCKAIILSPAAKGREAFALHLACQTNFTADAAIAMLGKAPAAVAAVPATSGHQRRLFPDTRPAPGYGPALSPQELAARMSAENGMGAPAPAFAGGALSAEEVARRVSV